MICLSLSSISFLETFHDTADSANERPTYSRTSGDQATFCPGGLGGCGGGVLDVTLDGTEGMYC